MMNFYLILLQEYWNMGICYKRHFQNTGYAEKRTHTQDNNMRRGNAI